MGHERIDRVFTELKAKGEKALIVYITAGDPDLATTAMLVREIAAAGADIIELGIPFSDPVADGPVIQKASQRALEAGTTTDGILQMVRDVRREVEVPLILMTYLNPIYRKGVAKFCRLAAEAGVDGLIIPDVPYEESNMVAKPAREAGIGFIPLIAPTTPSARMSVIASEGSGFVYAVSLTGVTGARNELSADVSVFLQELNKVSPLPVAVGFGISRPEHAAMLKEYCEGVIVGSAIVKMVEQIKTSSSILKEIQELIASFKKVLRG